MKSGKWLFVAVVATMLVAMAAVPAMAEVPMSVTQVRLAYNGRSSHSSDRVVAMVHVRDANMAAVEGAEVSATWTLPDGRKVDATAETEFQGIASFQLWAGYGEYELCVTNVQKDGWAYDPGQNTESCGSLLITWPFNPGPSY
jgi:hypothetical protein